MSDDPVIYRYTPTHAGMFLRGIPPRDLTQSDVDRLTGIDRANALSPNPATGKPLYVEVKQQAVKPAGKDNER